MNNTFDIPAVSGGGDEIYDKLDDVLAGGITTGSGDIGEGGDPIPKDFTMPDGTKVTLTSSGDVF